MKIGFLVECSPEGPDHVLMQLIMDVFCPEDELHIVPMINKGNLLAEASTEVAKLLKLGCDRVFVTWDWHPPERTWSAGAAKRWRPGMCRFEVHELRRQLAAGGINQDRVVLTCVPHELEAWALADRNAIQDVIEARKRRSVKGVPKTGKPENCPDPERLLENIFRKHEVELAKYADLQAIFYRAAQNRFKRFKSCPSFVRLVEKLTGQTFDHASGLT